MAMLCLGVSPTVPVDRLLGAWATIDGVEQVSIEATVAKARKLRWMTPGGKEGDDVAGALEALCAVASEVVVALHDDEQWRVFQGTLEDGALEVTFDDFWEEVLGRDDSASLGSILRKRFSRGDAEAFGTGEDWAQYRRAEGGAFAPAEAYVDMPYGLDWVEVFHWMPDDADDGDDEDDDDGGDDGDDAPGAEGALLPLDPAQWQAVERELRGPSPPLTTISRMIAARQAALRSDSVLDVAGVVRDLWRERQNASAITVGDARTLEMATMRLLELLTGEPPGHLERKGWPDVWRKQLAGVLGPLGSARIR